MSTRKIHDDQTYAHFVTFSCYKRRRILDTDTPRRIVISFLSSQLERCKGSCAGFVVMPEHVHALVQFDETRVLSRFMQQWKRQSSIKIKEHLGRARTTYVRAFAAGDPVWQPKYHDFNVYSEKKLREKLNYMHMNPVKAGLVPAPEEYPFSSARYYLVGAPVGVAITTL